jgi:hypothetical protein
VLYREIIAVCSQTDTTHKYTVWAERRIVEWLNRVVYIVTTGFWGVHTNFFVSLTVLTIPDCKNVIRFMQSSAARAYCLPLLLQINSQDGTAVEFSYGMAVWTRDDLSRFPVVFLSPGHRKLKKFLTSLSVSQDILLCAAIPGKYRLISLV